MPSTIPRRARVAAQQKTETLEDLEIKELKPRSPRQKEVDVTKILGGTITDKLAATAAFSVSSNMLKTVGREYAITPKEALNVAKPSLLIIEHFIPTVAIKSKLPVDIANNVELILVTLAEYFSRVLATFVEARFHVTLASQGIVARQQMPEKPLERSTPVQGPVEEDMYTEDVSDLPLENMLAKTGVTPKQTSPGPTGFDFAELIADGVIVGDNGNNY
jgi:hypothetical protein